MSVVVPATVCIQSVLSLMFSMLIFGSSYLIKHLDGYCI